MRLGMALGLESGSGSVLVSGVVSGSGSGSGLGSCHKDHVPSFPVDLASSLDLASSQTSIQVAIPPENLMKGLTK
jgi:hypothetical protein